MTPELTKLMEHLAKIDGNNFAQPQLRSMWPTKSRGQMATMFENSFSRGFIAAVQAMEEKQKGLVEALEHYQGASVCLKNGDTFVADEALAKFRG